MNHSQATIPADQYQDSWTLATVNGEWRACGGDLLPQIEPVRGEPQNVPLREGLLEPDSYMLPWIVAELRSSAAQLEIISDESGPQLGIFSMD